MRSTQRIIAQAWPFGPFAVWPKSGGRTRGAITLPSFRHPPPRTSPPTDRCDDPRPAEAFDAIVAALPLETVAYEPNVKAKGERLIWLEPAWVDKLTAPARVTAT
jgi:hypothetical protein